MTNIAILKMAIYSRFFHKKMVIFHSYVSLPEATGHLAFKTRWQCCILWADFGWEQSSALELCRLISRRSQTYRGCPICTCDFVDPFHLRGVLQVINACRLAIGRGNIHLPMLIEHLLGVNPGLMSILLDCVGSSIGEPLPKSDQHLTWFTHYPLVMTNIAIENGHRNS